ncbi:hypothetical protein HK100_010564, partial [Physocladia obscura]
SERALENAALIPGEKKDLSLRHSSPDDALHRFPVPPYLLETWQNVLDAARIAGEELGKRVILGCAYGRRPMILTGYGIGARVIYFALVEVVKAAEAGDGSLFR